MREPLRRKCLFSKLWAFTIEQILSVLFMSCTLRLSFFLYFFTIFCSSHIFSLFTLSSPAKISLVRTYMPVNHATSKTFPLWFITGHVYYYKTFFYTKLPLAIRYQDVVKNIICSHSRACMWRKFEIRVYTYISLSLPHQNLVCYSESRPFHMGPCIMLVPKIYP